MFTLRKNEFFNKGECFYKDEHGNTAVFKRLDTNTFEGTITFANDSVKAAPMKIKLPMEDGSDGDFLHIDFENYESRQDIRVVEGITNFGKLIQHWIDLLYEIMNFGSFDSSDANALAYATGVLNRLETYDEVRPFVRSIMESNYNGGMVVKK